MISLNQADGKLLAIISCFGRKAIIFKSEKALISRKNFETRALNSKKKCREQSNGGYREWKTAKGDKIHIALVWQLR